MEESSMKVKVKVKHAPLNQVEYFLNEALSEALADLDAAHREIEKLFQENKDLRLVESHLRDDLAGAKAQIESLETQLTREKLANAALESSLEETTAELVKHELNHYKNEAEEWKMTTDTLSDRLRELQAEFAELQIEHQELSEDYDALVKTKCDYAEEIDRLRKVVINLQTNRFTYEEVIKMIMNHVVPSTDQ